MSIVLHRILFLTAKQGSRPYDTKHHTFPTSMLLSSTLCQTFLSLCFLPHSSPPHSCRSPVTCHSQKLLKREYLSHCFIYTARSDESNCCYSSGMLKSNMTLSDHNLSFFEDFAHLDSWCQCYLSDYQLLLPSPEILNNALISSTPLETSLIPIGKTPILNLYHNLPPLLTYLRYSIRIPMIFNLSGVFIQEYI